MPAERQRSFPQGQIGNFEITGFVGEGGMGIIYKARDLALDRTVAVKVLREELRAQADTVTRFRREGQAAAILSHPNIVQIYAVGTEDNLPYIAMDFIKGRPLSVVMQQDGPMPWKRALNIGGQVASALACAHEAQVIHRDVKPGNILLDASDTAFVTDFGIAKILTIEEQLTVDGTRLGTPQYMAPERCREGAATAAGDIYALGVLIFQMISGRLPYEASNSVELVRKILSAPPYRLRQFVPQLPEPVERLVAYLIERRPEDRPASAEEAAQLMATVREGGSLEGVGNSIESALADFRQSGPPRLSWTEDPTTIFMPGGPLAQFTLYWFGTPKPWLLAVAGLLFLLAGVLAGMGVGKLMEPHPDALAQRGVDRNVALWEAEPQVAAFSGSASALTVTPRLEGYILSTGVWAGSHAYALLTRSGGISPGQGHCVLALQPGKRQAALIMAPVAPEAHTQVLGPLPAEVSPGAGVLLLEGRPGSYHLWGAQPSASEGGLWAVFAGAQWLRTPARLASMPRTGRFIVLAMPGEEQDQLMTAPLPPSEAPRTLIREYGRIQSLAVSPSGSHVAYTVDLHDNPAVLKILDLSSGFSSEVAQAVAPLSPQCWRADGGGLVYGLTSGTASSAAALDDIDAAAVPLDLGPGERPAWYAQDSRILLTAPGANGKPQLFALALQDPARRTQVTEFPGGVTGGCSADPDGNWVMTGTPDGRLHFIQGTRVAGAG